MKLPDDVKQLSSPAEMEKRCPPARRPRRAGKASRIADAADATSSGGKGTFPNEQPTNGLKVVLWDCANGATYHIAPNELRELARPLSPSAVSQTASTLTKKRGAIDARVAGARVGGEGGPRHRA
ncbi:hypothetical protein KCP73_15615 [Salmonella enterica subsp. enterica]|nr:hypothetical protein KCP73_15615 [Salmonella enterica subsp. enterica]